MQRWSSRELTSETHSTDFHCPQCGAGSFDLIGVERRPGEQNETQCALVMRCMICQAQFWHWAQASSSSPQDIDRAPVAVAAQS